MRLGIILDHCLRQRKSKIRQFSWFLNSAIDQYSFFVLEFLSGKHASVKALNVLNVLLVSRSINFVRMLLLLSFPGYPVDEMDERILVWAVLGNLSLEVLEKLILCRLVLTRDSCCPVLAFAFRLGILVDLDQRRLLPVRPLFTLFRIPDKA